MVWRPLGSWSGRGSAQTESVTSDSGTVRVTWETRNEPHKDAGTFRLLFQSAVSGRLLAVATEQRGVGQGESVIPESPRPVYFRIESEDIDWSITVDEGLVGTLRESTNKE